MQNSHYHTSQMLQVDSPAWMPPHYVRSLSLAIPAVLFGFQISGWVFALRALAEGRVDFRAMYAAGYLIRSGKAPALFDYTGQLLVQNRLTVARDMTLPFNHLPYEALLYVPLSYLPFKAAYFGMLVTNLALLAIVILLLRRKTSMLDGIYPWLSTILVITFLPTSVALMQGQDSVLILLCLTISFLLLEGKREFLAGLVLSAGLFKFQIVLPIAFLFLLWKRWRFVGGFSASAVSLLSVSFALVGKTAAISYFHLLMSMSTRLNSAEEQLRLSILPTGMPNLRGLIFCLFNGYLHPTWIQVLIFTLSAGCLCATWIGGSKARGGTSLLVAVSAAAAVSYHFNYHDMTILLLPIIVLLDQHITSLPSGPRYRQQVAVWSALTFTAPVLFCFAPAHFFLAAVVVCGLLIALLQWLRFEAATEPKCGDEYTALANVTEPKFARN